MTTMTTTNQQSTERTDDPRRTTAAPELSSAVVGHPSSVVTPIAQRAGESWLFTWDCSICMDSGIEVGMFGPERCDYCQAHLSPKSELIYKATLDLRYRQGQQVDEQLLNLARALVPATAEAPIQGDALAYLLECPERRVKEMVALLCEEWTIAAIATRKPPYGYFLATTAEELLEWGRVTRSQAIRMLARFYHLYKTLFPELAGQQNLFVTQVTGELEEAIR